MPSTCLKRHFYHLLKLHITKSWKNTIAINKELGHKSQNLPFSTVNINLTKQSLSAFCHISNFGFLFVVREARG